MLLYGVSRNTVSNWVKSGLQPSDRKKPYVFSGSVVKAFHKGRRLRSKKNLRPGEFKCVHCKMAVFPDEVERLCGRIGAGMQLRGICPDCGGTVSKFGSDADLEENRSPSNPNTSVGATHEEKQAIRACIGIGPSKNDRLLSAWQVYAGKYAEVTIDRHLAAIRFMEEQLDGKRFDKLEVADVNRVRRVLKEKMDATGENRLSRSYVSHIASHIREFLTWLIKQEVAKSLPKDLPDYIPLPKSAYAASLPAEARQFPEMDEAEALLRSMPEITIAQKRDRAIFAIAFLGSLRADTIVSLRIKHVDCEKRVILQDGTVSRTKNGKSLKITWFKIPQVFADVVSDWVAMMREKGFRPDDALFPDLKSFRGDQSDRGPKCSQIDPMTSKGAVTRAFASACRDHHTAYSPHSAKDTIALERDRRKLTAEQRKAWSQNMGHESEQTTDRYYAKMSTEQVMSVMDGIGEEKDGGLVLENISNEELGALLRVALQQMS